MRNNRALSREVFSAVRLLIKGGGSAEECTEYFKISQNTYYRIKRCENWEEYRQMLAAIALAEKERKNKAKAETEKIEETEKVTNVEPVKVEAKVDPVPETKVTAANHLMASNYQVNRLIEEVRMQNEYLKQISAKLAFIVESFA